MPTYFMLSADETSLLTLTSEAQGAIEAAMDHVNMQGRSFRPGGRWYSPTRIDRSDPLTRATQTRVQRVLAVNDDVADPATKAAEIANNMKQALDHVGDGLTGINYQNWTDVSVNPFSDAQYGSLASWHSGAATRSETAGQFANPLSGIGNIMPNLKFVLIAVGVGVGAFLLWPVLTGLRGAAGAAKSAISKAARAPAPARSNPSRRRRGSRKRAR